MIDFKPSPEQVQITDSIAGYLTANFPLERLQPKRQGKTVRSAWRELADQGFFGLGAPESIGGADFTVVEEMLAHREFARALISPSVLATVVAVHVLADAGRNDIAAGLIAGDRPVSLALPRGVGELHLLDAEPGDLVLLAADDRLTLLERDDLAEISPVSSLDESVSLHRARSESAAPVAAGPALRLNLLLAAALVGMAEASRDAAVEHAKFREQFGKPIGSFQGVAHHCADMELRARAARAETAFAAMALADSRSEAAFHISAAAIVAADAAIRNATMAIRVLGAMGFTAESPLHHYLKRSHLYERLAGGTRKLQADLLRHDAAPASADL
jgi:alkylation response protein AidB-like acyl-CoA dehydrogenase